MRHDETIALIIPTGIGADIGGYAGDGGKIARMFSKHFNVITHPNVVNGGILSAINDDILYVEKDNETIRKYTDARYIEYTVCPFDSLEIKNVNKILAIKYGDADTVTGWVNYLSAKYPELYIVKSTPYFCEISNKDAKKSCAVEYLCRKWGIKKDEVLAIGDQNNDIELLKAGGIKVAMGNGTPELKECADFITDTVENNGFVKAVNKFCR